MSQQKQMFGITEQQVKNLIDYLSLRPYRETAPMIAELSSLPLFNVTEPSPKETSPTPEQGGSIAD